MTRVFALVTDAYGGRGGIAQAARDVIGAMAALAEVTRIDVLPRQAPEPASDLPEKVRQAPASPGRLVYTARALAHAAMAKPDLIFCNHLYMAPLAALAARQLGAKLVVQMHGIEIWPEPTPGRRKALEAADLLLCVSRDTRARTLTHCDLTPERVVVLNNTVDPRFTPCDREAARAKFGLQDEFALLIVGRLDARERYKGHDRVIAALPSLTHPEGRPVIFLVAGDGDDRGRLKAAAAAVGVADHVRFLGRISDTDLADLYRAADLFVLPSTGEGFGIVFLEAMACGTPSLGLAFGGAPDALADGGLGMLVDMNEDFGAALQKAVLAPPPNPRWLSDQIHRRFGAEAFQTRVSDALGRMPKPKNLVSA